MNNTNQMNQINPSRESRSTPSGAFSRCATRGNHRSSRMTKSFSRSLLRLASCPPRPVAFSLTFRYGAQLEFYQGVEKQFRNEGNVGRRRSRMAPAHPAGCLKSPSSKAAASEEAKRYKPHFVWAVRPCNGSWRTEKPLQCFRPPSNFSSQR